MLRLLRDQASLTRPIFSLCHAPFFPDITRFFFLNLTPAPLASWGISPSSRKRERRRPESESVALFYYSLLVIEELKSRSKSQMQVGQYYYFY